MTWSSRFSYEAGSWLARTMMWNLLSGISVVPPRAWWLNARSTAASDMQDYSLDQQTVSGANGTYKTSSQYSNVWSNPNGPALSNGRTFGSTDNTIDPNSATDNSWTKDTKVHGNGQPY
ncbi:MAG: hypothetical protein ABI164_05730 [Acidobacteriaceae bacterium]